MYILHIYIFTSFSISYTFFVLSSCLNLFAIMFSVSSYYSFLHSLIFLFMIFVFLFCYFIDFLIFILYLYLYLILHLFFGAFLLCKNLGYLLIAFRNSSIAEFYIIKLYTCTIYISSFLYNKPIFCIKSRTSFLYSLALSLSLSLTAMQVPSISFLLISRLLSIFYLFIHVNSILLILF